ncbi:MAG TPA: type IX secretion system sortase PorU [Candidatus Kapabacteria bacterium]|nr:type IX secretion system sortase PorU [Candidatus Kapabacteria bacterium]
MHSVFYLIKIFRERSHARYAVIVLAACSLFAFPRYLAAGADAPDYKIISSNAQEIVLEYRPVYTPAETLSIEGKRYLQIHFKNESAIHPGNAGTPEILGRPFTVGLPSLTGNSVEVLSAEYEQVQGVPAPMPSLIHSADKLGMTEKYVVDAAAYRSPASFPTTAAKLQDFGRIRNERVGQLVLYPVLYSPGASVIRKATRILVRVRFSSSAQISGKLSAFDNNLKGVLLNESIAKSWAIPAAVHPRTLNAQNYFGTESARIDVTTDGMVSISAAQLASAGINVSAIDPATIQIYGDGGRELPETFVDSIPNTPRELAISVFTNDTGGFDHLIFYAKGPYGWNYNSSTKTFSHYINNYSTVSSYIFTYGAAKGKRIQTVAATGNPTITPQTFRDHLFHEDENENAFVLAGGVGSGREWFMTPVNPEQTAGYNELLQDINLNGGNVSYNVAVAGQCSSAQSFDVYEGNTYLGSLPISSTTADDILFRVDGSFTSSVSNLSGGGRSNLRFLYHAQGGAGIGAVDWYEISFDRYFIGESNALHFWAPDTTGTVEFSLQNFSTQPAIYDVTDDGNVVQIPVVNYNSNFTTVDMNVTAGSAHELYAVTPAAYAQPQTIQKITIAGLRNMGNSAQFIIITDASLLEAANRLRDYRNGQQLSTMVVTTDQIYNEFSSGMHDVTAIRDFLRYAYTQWYGKPFYVLLFGDGSYDYKNDAANFVPAYETPIADNDFNDITSVATDDFYAKIVGTDPYLDLGLGRLCVRSLADADNVVTKIIHYETQSDDGSWRNKLAFVADDNFSGPGVDYETEFTYDTEDLIASSVPPTFDIQKIYEVAYTTVFSGLNNTGGRTKPGAYADIVNAFNNGSLLIGWIGHGNPHVWAHEQIFVNETTIPQLVNYNRLPFVTAATCDFGRFDDPSYESGTEQLVTKPDGGAIAVYSSSRAGFEPNNKDVNEWFDRNLLYGRDQGLPLRLGNVVFLTRQNVSDQTNDSKFYLQGDPTLRLLMPTNPAVVEKANNVDVTVNVDTMKALMRVTLTGSVRHADSTLWSDFNGTADITVYDSKRNVAVQSGAYLFQFAVQGSILFNGQSSVQNGKFTTTFIVPKDISYENENGKITVYAVNGSGEDAVGSTQNIIVGGTDTSHILDTQGPTIKLYLDSRSFHPGDYVSAQPLLIVDLADSSGINASETALGHGIEAWVDDAVTSIDLTSTYRSNLNDVTHGTAQQTLLNLDPGTHLVRVRAWDVYNNPTETTTTFVISSAGSGLTVANVMNIPNPFSNNGTTFTLQQNQTVPVDVLIKIYTVAGRLIQTLEDDGITQHFVTIPWDGRDRDGSTIGNGVYLYKVIVKTDDGLQTNETIGRMAVLR